MRGISYVRIRIKAFSIDTCIDMYHEHTVGGRRSKGNDPVSFYAHVGLDAVAVDVLLVDDIDDPVFWSFPYTLQHVYRLQRRRRPSQR